MSLLIALLATSVTPEPAQAPSPPLPERVERHVVALRGVRDLDGDKVPDLCLRAVRGSEVSELLALSAANGTLLWNVPAPTGFGERSAAPALQGIAPLSDLDRDGTGEIAVVWRRAEREGSGHQHALAIHSGRTGDVLRLMGLGRDAEELPGTCLVPTGDLDHDLNPDLLVLAPQNELRPGVLSALSPATGDVLWSTRCRAPYTENGVALAPVRDVDGDGTLDVAVVVPEAVEVLSGKDGRGVRRFETRGLGWWPGEGAEWTLTGQLVAIGDLDGDSAQELVVPARQVLGDETVALVVSSATGALVLRAPLGVRSVEAYGMGLRAGGDFDGDGPPEVVLADPFWNLAGVPVRAGVDAGFVRVLSGRDLHELRSWEGGRCSMWLGAFVTPAGDVDRDGTPDVWMTTSETCERVRQAVGLASGRTGELLRWIDLDRIPVEPAR
jgi:hypothetical protein